MTTETLEMIRQDSERQFWISHYMLMGSQVILVLLIVGMAAVLLAMVCHWLYTLVEECPVVKPPIPKPACTICGQPIETYEKHGGATGCLDAYTAKHYSRPN